MLVITFGGCGCVVATTFATTPVCDIKHYLIIGLLFVFPKKSKPVRVQLVFYMGERSLS